VVSETNHVGHSLLSMYVLCECVCLAHMRLNLVLFYLSVFSQLSVYVKSEDVNDEL
jgi:hypothetical protein